jgi:hypothetical protein
MVLKTLNVGVFSFSYLQADYPRSWDSISLSPYSFHTLVRLAQKGANFGFEEDDGKCAKSKVPCRKCNTKWSCPAYRYKAEQLSRMMRIQIDSSRREVYAYNFSLENMKAMHRFFSLMDNTSDIIGGFSLDRKKYSDTFKITFNSSLRLAVQ